VTETARAEVGRCHAEYQLEALNIQRKKELREANAIPEQELDEAKSKFSIAEARGRIAQAGVTSGKADVMVAEAEVIQAAATMGRIKTLMNYATIRAPFDGVVTRRLVDHGDFVRSAADGASSPMFTVAKVDRIRISLEIPEPDAPDVRIGTEVEIEIKALRGEPIQATITRTAFALDPSTRTMRAEVDLDNQNMKLVPGMYAQVDITLESMDSALVIPSKAIRVRGTELSVLVASNNIVKKMPIKIGYDDGIVAEIVGGLVGDELIITSATSAISPGVAVNPVMTDP
jgi:RND family efflux transporter MFP subunit